MKGTRPLDNDEIRRGVESQTAHNLELVKNV